EPLRAVILSVASLAPFNPLPAQRYADHPHLHSFPTRRSSDLRRRATAAPVRGEHRGRLGARPRDRSVWSARLAPGRRTTDEGGRSEEHTSELQSHLNLVCRLLLEKRITNAHITVNDSMQISIL